MNWSTSLQRFVVISSKELFLLDDKTMIIKCYQIKFPFNSIWGYITSTEKHLFISTYGLNPLIIQCQLFPSILFSKILKKQICLNENDLINDIQSNENQLYVIIEDHRRNKSSCRIYSIKSFEMINEIFIGNGWNYKLTLFNNRYLILLDQMNNCLTYITKEGNILKKEFYHTKAINFISFGNNQIIIQSKSHFNLHQTQ